MGDKLRVLCVDDEPNLLEGLTLHLRRHYQVVTAPGGRQGLAALEAGPGFAVVLSDMRMPEMDGATFLSHVRQRAPDAVRLLLTGYSDIDGAIAAVNEGQVFRFLTKPCPPPVLLQAFAAAAAQHRLIMAERVLLEQTLHGCIRALANLLALTKPMVFGRALRIQAHMTRLAEALSLPERWQYGVAALLSQVGYVTLRPETVERLYYGHALSSEEVSLAARLPQVAEQVIGPIPRLEPIRDILVHQGRRFVAASAGEVAGEALPLGARLLRIVHDYDVLETQGLLPGPALDTLRGRAGVYDPALLEAFAALLGSGGPAEEIHELPLRQLRPGMIFAEDIRGATGALLIARGYEVTPSLLARIHNFPPGLLHEPVRVRVAVTGAAARG